jgi:HK97 family phage prohead protease
VTVTGTPVVYDQSYVVRDFLGEFNEVMRAGVATEVLARGVDCRFLVDHGSSRLLARTKSGTLTLTDSANGLRMSAKLDLRDSDARNLLVRMERGDLDQMSCGFTVARDSWDATEENREIFAFGELLDVSAVTYPASPTTNISIGDLPAEARAQIQRAIASGKTLPRHQRGLVQATKATNGSARKSAPRVTRKELEGTVERARQRQALTQNRELREAMRQRGIDGADDGMLRRAKLAVEIAKRCL